MAAVGYPCCYDRTIPPAGIRGIPVVRSEVIYARVTSVMDLVLCATHHRAVVMTQAKLCDFGQGLLWLSSICEDKHHETSIVRTNTEPLNQSLSPYFAHF